MSFLDGYMRPDYGGMPSITGLQQYIQQGYAAGRAQGQNQQLAQLAQAAYNDTGDQQSQDVSKAIGIDPKFGYGLAAQTGAQSAAQQQQAQLKRYGGTASAIFQALRNGDKAGAEGLYQSVVPELAAMATKNGGTPPPSSLDAALADPKISGTMYQLAQMFGQGIPAPEKGVIVTPGAALVNPASGERMFANPAAPKITPQGYQAVLGPDGTYHAENIPIQGGGNGVGVGQAVPGVGANAAPQAQGSPQGAPTGVEFQWAPGTPESVKAAAMAAARANGDTGAAPLGQPQTLADVAASQKTKSSQDVIAQRAAQVQELKARGVNMTPEQEHAYLENGHMPSGSDAILSASMNTPLSPVALDESAVDFILKGPRGLPAYAYRDPVTAKQIQNHAGQMLQAAGLSPTMLPAIRGSAKAREGALVKMQAQGSMLARNIQSLDANVQLMLQDAQKVGNTNFKSWNALVLAAKGQVSDPDVAAYAQAVMNVLDDYGKVISMSTTSQGTTDTQLRLAQQRISQADGLPALQATAQMIEAGGKNIRDTTDNAINNLTNALKFGNLSEPASVTSGEGQPAPQSGAIPAGAIQMLRSNPSLAPQFDAKYGSGASQQYLGAGGG